jgi:hypothetical protein
MMDLLDPRSARPARRPDVLTCETREELVLYDPRADSALGLNVSASAIWQMCDGSRSIAEISRELAAVVGNEPHELVVDIERMVGELCALDVLEVVSAQRWPEVGGDA